MGIGCLGWWHDNGECALVAGSGHWRCSSRRHLYSDPGLRKMKKGTLLIAAAVGVGVMLVAPDAWATTGFQKIDEGLNKVITALTGLGGVAGAGGIIEMVTAWRFGHGGAIAGGGKTAVMGGGIGGAPQISTLAIGSGTSFDGSMLPVSELTALTHAALAFFS
jgi:hypothetical protein